jgi:hypothetical protein
MVNVFFSIDMEQQTIITILQIIQPISQGIVYYKCSGYIVPSLFVVLFVNVSILTRVMFRMTFPELCTYFGIQEHKTECVRVLIRNLNVTIRHIEAPRSLAKDTSYGRCDIQSVLFAVAHSCGQDVILRGLSVMLV